MLCSWLYVGISYAKYLNLLIDFLNILGRSCILHTFLNKTTDKYKNTIKGLKELLAGILCVKVS